MRIAATSGYNEAQNKMGDFYLNGFEMESESASEEDLMHCNNPQSLHSPHSIIVDSPTTHNGTHSLPFSPIKTKFNSHRSSYTIGRNNLKIVLVERNVKECVDWYTKAATTHLRIAQYNLSQCYHHNLIGSSDSCKNSAKWFALYSLGVE